ncbi:hypothetical protein D3C71_1552770 [compost metagenome]
MLPDLFGCLQPPLRGELVHLYSKLNSGQISFIRAFIEIGHLDKFQLSVQIILGEPHKLLLNCIHGAHLKQIAAFFITGIDDLGIVNPYREIRNVILI